jgi:Universal stress protein family
LNIDSSIVITACLDFIGVFPRTPFGFTLTAGLECDYLSASTAAAAGTTRSSWRGYGPVLRVLLGSVSTQLIHIAPCPVLVIPRPGPAAG